MGITFCDNSDPYVKDILHNALAGATDAKFAVAFIKTSGLNLITCDIESILQRGGSVEFLVGLDFMTTEPAALRRLIRLRSNEAQVKCYCFSGYRDRGAPTYHPKIYLIRNRANATVVLGSSNLTAGGLERNAEANLVITETLAQEIISDAYAVYGRLKFQPYRITPDEEYLEAYEDVYQYMRRHERTGRASARSFIERLIHIERSLPRPERTPSDLVGWLKAVYDRLPPGRFRSTDIYAFERELQTLYPNNNNVRAKIRQSLQFLRDMGFLTIPAPRTWEKV